MVTRTCLRYSRDYLPPGICSLIKPAAMANLISFPATTTTVMLLCTITHCLWGAPTRVMLSLCSMIFTPGQFWPSILPLLSRVCVRECDIHGIFRAIPRYPLKLETQNSDKICKTHWLRSPLFWRLIDLDFYVKISIIKYGLSTRANTQTPEKKHNQQSKYKGIPVLSFKGQFVFFKPW